MVEQHNEAITNDELYPAVLRNKTKGWVGSGFHHRYTEMKVRRIPKGKGGDTTLEHVQMEISIVTIKGKDSRMYTESASFSLTPEQADILVNALKTPVTY
jgi:hypothetical protein